MIAISLMQDLTKKKLKEIYFTQCTMSGGALDFCVGVHIIMFLVSIPEQHPRRFWGIFWYVIDFCQRFEAYVAAVTGLNPPFFY